MSTRTATQMTQDPSDTRGRLIAADEVQGTAVYSRGGEKLGSVEDVMIDKASGKACYGILSFGGFLGMGSERYPLPWEKLIYDTNMGGFVVGVTKESLQNAPTYASNTRWQDSDWRAVDTHYKTRSSF